MEKKRKAWNERNELKCTKRFKNSFFCNGFTLQ